MRSLGIIEFQDNEKHVRRHYVRDAISIEALKTFALNVAMYSKMNLMSVQWGADAEITYLTDIAEVHQNKSPWKFTFLVNPIMFSFKPVVPGQTSAGYTWQFIVSLCFHSSEKKRAWKKIAIPAPVFSMFHSARVRSDVGNAILADLSTLVNQPLSFSHGYVRMTQAFEDGR